MWWPHFCSVSKIKTYSDHWTHTPESALQLSPADLGAPDLAAPGSLTQNEQGMPPSPHSRRAPQSDAHGTRLAAPYKHDFGSGCHAYAETVVVGNGAYMAPDGASRAHKLPGGEGDEIHNAGKDARARRANCSHCGQRSHAQCPKQAQESDPPPV